MAAAVGVSKDAVQQVRSARGLKPHRVETFKLSNNPRFEEKLVDVVGLYLNPPEKACCAPTKSPLCMHSTAHNCRRRWSRPRRDDDPRL